MRQEQAALSPQQRYRIAKAQSQRLLARGYPEFDPNQPRDEAGRFGSGGAGDASSEKPKGGPKKKATKEDFKKAKIKLGDVSSEDDFVAIWNNKIGEDPETFKKSFMGGLDGTMTLGGSAQQINVQGIIESPDTGTNAGTFTRYLNPDDKTATSAYFSLHDSHTKSDIGKKLLAGNVETYERLGIEKINVTANINVGGYAWAKYGYVPTQSAWNSLRSRLERKLTGNRNERHEWGENTIEADEWDALTHDRQDDVRDKWMRESYSEFLDSEISNWRENGQALADAKRELAADLPENSIPPEFYDEALNDIRDEREKKGEPPIPYTNQQLYDAIKIFYEDRRGDGSEDPDINFDDDLLREPIGREGNKDQMTLPGIEPEDLSKSLTEEMREQLSDGLVYAFNKRAEQAADDMEPPGYLAESITEYQAEYWDGMEDTDKLRYAILYDMARIEIEPDPDAEEEPEKELALEPTKDALLEAVRSTNPKSIWKIADSPRGKELLLGTDWKGVLDLKDKESMARFKAYVGRKSHA